MQSRGGYTNENVEFLIFGPTLACHGLHLRVNMIY